jgi:hypothetical protein
MTATLTHIPPPAGAEAGATPPPAGFPPRVADDIAARRALRAQIARLEAQLGGLAGELGRPGRALALARAKAPTGGGPRLLGIAELEAARDDLVGRVRDSERAVAARTESEARARARVEAMLADPAAHRWQIVHREDLGEPGCGDYHVRPRLGLLGLMFDWWCVKLSSGCP